jgi:TolB-like protein
MFFMACATGGGTNGGLPRLAILPFTGGTAENGETIAMLLSNRPEIQKTFTAVPRTSITSVIAREGQFQRSGLISFDTLSKIGNDLKADFVVAGYTQQLTDRNLVLINIINVKTLQEVAGDYREYARVEDIRGLIPEMAKKIAGIKLGSANKSRLAVFPFDMREGTVQDAEILAQILAIDIANSGKYAVFPRTQTIAQVMEEHKRSPDLSDPDSIRELGNAVGADYVLAGKATNLESTKLFFVEILEVEKGGLVSGRDAEYHDIVDGLILIPMLAGFLTGQKTEAQMQQVENRLKRGRTQPAPKGKPEENSDTQPVKTYKIGDAGPGGGTVFLVEGNTGLEVSRVLGSYSWAEAIDTAKKYDGGSFSDWYLPSKDELNFIYVNLQKAGVVNLGSDLYWSSSKNDSDSYSYRAWTQEFSNGLQETKNRNNTYSVRAVRAFYSQQRIPKNADWEAVKNAARRNSFEGPSLIFYGDADMDAADATSGFTNEVAVHFSPMPFVSLGIAIGSGWFDGRNVGTVGEYSAARDFHRPVWTLSPELGFVFPLTTGNKDLQMHLFGDGIIQIDDIHEGIISDSMTPGVDVGLSLSFDNGLGMNLTYKGLWYANEVYTHGVGVSFHFWPVGRYDDDANYPGWMTWGLGSGLWLGIIGIGSIVG